MRQRNPPITILLVSIHYLPVFAFSMDKRRFGQLLTWLPPVALKKKHNKNDQESKYTSTVLGKGNDHGDIAVEGGPVSSVKDWEQMMREAARRPREPTPDSRPPSSGLSSLADDDVEMMEMEI